MIMRSSTTFSTATLYNKRLQAFIHQTPDITLLAHVAQQASVVIACHPPPSKQPVQIPPLPLFVTFLANRSQASSGTLLTALVLMDRLQSRLAPVAKGISCTCQRIFLATLIVTFKILHDSTPRNSHWARFARYFSVAEINLMEKQLLALLDYDLSITMDDLYGALARYDCSRQQLSLPQVITKRERGVSPRPSASSSTSSSSSSSVNSMSPVPSIAFSMSGSALPVSSDESAHKEHPAFVINSYCIDQEVMWQDPLRPQPSAEAAAHRRPTLAPSPLSHWRRHHRNISRAP